MNLGFAGGVIRSFRREEALPLVKIANDREVWRQLRDRFPHPYTRSDAQAWLKLVAEMPCETSFAIECGGELAGGIGLELGSDIERVSAELGYWLGRRFWGRGLATEAVSTFVPYAFSAHAELARIYATAKTDNVASCRVLEKSGFTREGTLRNAAIKEGRLIDLALYAILRG